MAAFLIALALLWVVVLLLTRRAAPGRPRPPADWEARVLAQTRGNRGALERAVTAKRKRFPQASRAELLRMVHEDYQRDRR